MKFKLCLVMTSSLLFLFQFSNSVNLISQSCKLISQSCKVASDRDPNLSYDFCNSTLVDAISNKNNTPPNCLEDLVAVSIDLTKSNGTGIISKISDLLKKNRPKDRYAKACLQDCLDLYKDSLSDLEEAVAAFKSKDWGTACIKLSAALDDPVTCEDQFKDNEGVKSPLTKENQIYFQLSVISLAFTQMCHQRF